MRIRQPFNLGTIFRWSLRSRERAPPLGRSRELLDLICFPLRWKVKGDGCAGNYLSYMKTFIDKHLLAVLLVVTALVAVEVIVFLVVFA
jgi:hypothetical protein